MKGKFDPIRSARPVGIHILAVLCSLATLPLLLSGGLMVSTESSLAVPDWPTSYGVWMPPMVGGVFFEHGHRMIGATVGFLTLITALWALFTEERSWVRRLAIFGLAAVTCQGILGGMTVLHLLPLVLSVSHGCLAQIFFCLMLSLALLTAPWWRPDELQDSAARPDMTTITTMMFVVPLVQLLLGALLRMSRPHISVPLIAAHAVWATMVVATAAWLAVRLWTSALPPRVARTFSLGLIGLVLPQFFLGLAAFIARQQSLTAPQPTLAKIIFPTIHHFTGAMILGISLVLFILFRAPRAVAEAESAPGTVPEPHPAHECCGGHA